MSSTIDELVDMVNNTPADIYVENNTLIVYNLQDTLTDAEIDLVKQELNDHPLVNSVEFYTSLEQPEMDRLIDEVLPLRDRFEVVKFVMYYATDTVRSIDKLADWLMTPRTNQRPIVTTLVLNGCRIGAAGLNAIGNALEFNHSIRNLNLSEIFQLRLDGPEELIDGFAHGLDTNPGLETLVLYSNAFSNAQVQDICNAIQGTMIAGSGLCRIRNINLDHTDLSPVAINMILMMFFNCVHLQTLELSNTKNLNSENLLNIVVIIARAEKQMDISIDLDSVSEEVSNAFINVVFIPQLRTALVHSEYIRTLDLGRTQRLSKEAYGLLLEGVERNNSLHIINLIDHDNVHDIEHIQNSVAIRRLKRRMTS